MDDNFKAPDFNDFDFNLDVDVETSNGGMDEVKEIFNYEKDSPTIQKELDIHNAGKQTEATKGFSLNDLGGNDEGDNLSSVASSSEEEEQGEQAGEIEDYFESAEFIIFITEAIILFGTNFYLKSNALEKVTIEAFKKTAGQQKALKKAWARVLQKHNAKVSPEVELLMVLGSAYGMKVSSIIDEQKAKKKVELVNKSKIKPLEKTEKKTVVRDIKNEFESTEFSVDFDNVEEVEEAVVEKPKKEKIQTPKGGITSLVKN